MVDDEAGGLDPTQAPSQPATLKDKVANSGTEQTLTHATDHTLESGGAGSSSGRLIRPPAEATPSKPDYPSLVFVDPAHYVLGDKIAAGGMGQITRARDRRLGRAIALKTLLGDNSSLALRFEREARITARLQHPGIVQLHEAGRWPSGQPFFAMKLVEGKSLDDVIDGCKTLAERLALMPNVVAIAEAMAYAHEHHVIHRDIKPKNVLVGAFGETVVIDWGLAKDLDDATTPDIPAGPYRGGDGMTIAGDVIGTPAYMPAEQARGEPVDERADVYAIGALMYHVLSGSAPYRGSSVNDILHQLKSLPPAPLATEGLPPDLIAIVDKAMARDKEDRYRTAVELATDLRRFTNGQLVAAHTYSTWQLARRWIRKYRGVVIASMVATLALGGFGAYSIRRIVRERDDAEEARRLMTERDDRLAIEHAREIADADPTLAIATLGKLRADSPHWGELRPLLVAAWQRGIAQHVLTGHEHAPARLVFANDGRVISAGPEGTVRSWSATGEPQPALEGHRGAVTDIAVSRDGSRIASLGSDGVVMLWAAGRGRALAPVGEQVTRLVGFTHDDRHVAVLTRASLLVCPVGEGPCRRLVPKTPSLTTGKIRTIIEPTGREVTTRTVEVWSDWIDRAMASPVTGVVVACGRGQAIAWDVDSGEEIWVGGGTSCLVTPAGVVMKRDASIVVLDVRTGTQLREHRQKSKPAGVLAVSRDGTRFAVAGDDLAVEDFTTGDHDMIATAPYGADDRKAGSIKAKQPKLEYLDFSSAGDRIAWKYGDEIRIATLRGHQIRDVWVVPGARAIAWAPDGKRFATAHVDGSVRLWRAADSRGKFPIARIDVKAMSASSDGRTVAVLGRELVVTSWRDGKTAALALEGCSTAALSPDAKWATAICGDKTKLWRVGDREATELPKQASAWLRDSRLLSWRWTEPALALGEPGAAPRHIALGAVDSFTQVRVARDAPVAAVLTSTGTLLFADLTAGKVVGSIATPCSADAPSAIAWDGGRFACGAGQAIWIGQTNGAPIELRGHFATITGVEFLPDGRLASTAGDETLRVWNADGGSRSYRIDSDVIQTPIAGRDGTLITQGDRTRIWDLVSGRASVPPIPATRMLPLGRAFAVATSSEVVVFTDDLPSGNYPDWIRETTQAVRE